MYLANILVVMLLMGTALLLMKMEVRIAVSGKMVRITDKALIFMQMEIRMSVSGKMV